MPNKKIETLEEIIPNLIPTEPLKGDEFREYYVNCDDVRGGRITSNIASQLKFSKGRTPKLLFAGHTGCGTSTELNRLIEELKNDLFIVHFSSTELLDINDAEYTDILLTIGRELYDQSKRSLELSKERIRVIEDWFTEIYQEAVRESGGIGLNLRTPIGEFENVLKSPVHRITSRKVVSPRVSELISKLNLLIAEIKIKSKKDLLLIIDNLDRLIPSKAEDIFINHGFQLASLLCKVIYTIPISLIYSAKAGALDQIFSSSKVLPMIKIINKDNSIYKEGRERLKQIITKRINSNLFEKRALEALIYFSAGNPKNLLNFTADASKPAIRKGQARIKISDVKEIIREHRNRYVRQIPKENYQLLANVYKTKEIENDEPHQLMLYNLSILEYNSEQFYDVHSIVKLILMEKGLIEDEEIRQSWSDFI